MFKKLLILNLILLNQLVWSAKLSPLLSNSLEKRFNSKIHQINKQSKNNNVIDFSGHWVGQCDDEPGIEDVLDIEQSITNMTIKINGTELLLDSLSNNNIQADLVSANTSTHLHWNESGEELTAILQGYMKAGSFSEGDLFTFTGKSNLSLENQQLHIKYNMLIFIDGELIDKLNERCVYSKVENKSK